MVGFSETVQQMMERSNIVIVDKLNDIRIIGIVVVIVLLGITLIGMAITTRYFIASDIPLLCFR